LLPYNFARRRKVKLAGQVVEFLEAVVFGVTVRADVKVLLHVFEVRPFEFSIEQGHQFNSVFIAHLRKPLACYRVTSSSHRPNRQDYCEKFFGHPAKSASYSPMKYSAAKATFDSAARDYDRLRRKFIPCFDEFYRCAIAELPFERDAAIRILDLGAG